MLRNSHPPHIRSTNPATLGGRKFVGIKKVVNEEREPGPDLTGVRDSQARRAAPDQRRRNLATTVSERGLEAHMVLSPRRPFMAPQVTISPNGRMSLLADIRKRLGALLPLLKDEPPA
jgi:hypothetical protein